MCRAFETSKVCDWPLLYHGRGASLEPPETVASATAARNPDAALLNDHVLDIGAIVAKAQFPPRQLTQESSTLGAAPRVEAHVSAIPSGTDSPCTAAR